MSLVAGTLDEWQLQTTATHLATFTQYKFRCYGTDGFLFSGGSSASAVRSPFATFTYAAGVIITITSPTAAQVLAASSHTFTWTTPGTQQKFRLWVYDDVTGDEEYDTGEIVSAITSHAAPAGTLRNDTDYYVVVQAWNAGGATNGTSAPRSFRTAFAAPPVLDFSGNAVYEPGDINASAVQLQWSPTAVELGKFVEYELVRRVVGEPRRNQVRLLRTTDPAHLSYLDKTPGSTVPYIWEIRQTTKEGVDELTSAWTQISMTLTFEETIISDPFSDERVVLPSRSERRMPRKHDKALLVPWGQAEPITLFGSTYYREISAEYIIDALDQAGYRDNVAIRALFAAIDTMSKKGGVGGALLYRDGRGRRDWGAIIDVEGIDPTRGRQERATILWRQTGYKEGVR
jgi:hypothetical protein